MPIVLKSGNLNHLEPSGPVQACNGIDLPFRFILEKIKDNILVKKFTAFFWNPKVHYRVQNNLLFVPILSQINPVWALPVDLLKVLCRLIGIFKVSIGLSCSLLATTDSGSVDPEHVYPKSDCLRETGICVVWCVCVTAVKLHGM